MVPRAPAAWPNPSMKIYKYRTLRPGDDLSLARMDRIVNHRLVWCARPDTLNDPDEFAWTCDFAESPNTVEVVADLLEETKGHSRPEALRRALAAIRSGNLEALGAPVIDEMIRQTRDEIGVACFAITPDNRTLWSRYADEGRGVCVELEVPDSLLGSQLHPVVYDDNRRIHIDEFLRSRSDLGAATGVYGTLLTKTKYWECEREIRFLSKRPQVEVVIDGSTVTRVVLGPMADRSVTAIVEHLARSISVSRIDAGVLTPACS